MKKTLFMLILCALALSGAFAGGEKDKAAAPKLTVTIAHNQTSLDNPYVFGANAFKAELEKLSGGTIEVITHHGTMGENENELVEKMEMGAISVVLASPGFMTGAGVPEVDMLSLLYLFNDFNHWQAAMDGKFGDTMKNIIWEKSGHRFKVLGYWTAAVRDYYGKKKVVNPADVKGLTLRTQTAQVVQDFWKAAGAIPVSIAWGELYQALQQGVVDSAENDYTNFSLKEHHKTPNGHFISETHHDYTTRLLLTSGSFWGKLTPEQQGWVEAAAKAATAEERNVTNRMSDESKARVIADGAVVTDFKDVNIKAFQALAIPIQDKFAKDNKMEDLLNMVRSAK